MRVNTPEYKLWKQKQNEKNLIKRTKAKKKCKKQSNIKKSPKKVPNRTFKVPQNFSIVDNPEITISFLNEIIKSVEGIRNLQKQRKSNFIRTFLIDMSLTENITSDALMYLLTIIQNTRGEKLLPIDWIGNFPKKVEVREYLKRSGYLKFMRTASENIHQVDDNIFSNNVI